MRTLLITNDFPPRQGGIQSFVYQLARGQPEGSLVVYASDHPRAAEFDATQPFDVVRARSPLLLPTAATGRRAVELARSYDCGAVVFGAAAPLGLLAPRLRREAGVDRVLALTHGHEVGWATLPGARTTLRRIGQGVDVLTYLTDYTRRRLAPVLGGVTQLSRLAPGVDVDTFHPAVDGGVVRRRYGLGERPVVVCVSRLVRRKGQDLLLQAWPRVRQDIPDARLLLVGEGPARGRLQRLARSYGLAGEVVFTGAVPQAELPGHFAAGDVYAMPCRTRLGGLDLEGLGVVFLEAAATGLPVVAGDSGGAPEAVREGRTGFVVDGRRADHLVARLVTLLRDRALAARMGAQGRRWVEAEWRWQTQAARLTKLLAGVPATPGS